jgi:hypothetical protein
MSAFHKHESLFAQRHAEILEKGVTLTMSKRKADSPSLDYATIFPQNRELDLQASLYQKDFDFNSPADDPIRKLFGPWAHLERGIR